MSKTVRLTLELKESYVKLLDFRMNSQPSVHALLTSREGGQIDTLDVLGMLVLMEARGSFPEEIHAATPLEWRNELCLIHDQREVIEERDV